MRALILAGGFATRLRPLTDTVPKSLVPICNRPLLEQQVRLLAAHGVREAILLTGFLAERFDEVCERIQRELGVRLVISTEEKPLGTAGAVRSVLDRLDATTLVFNGDVVTDLDVTAMLALHRDAAAAVTIALTRVEDARSYGLVPLDADGRVLEFREKPPDPVAGWINAGTYVLEPSVLERVPADTFWQFEQSLFPDLLAAGEPVYGFPSEAYWLDVGTPGRYLQAHVDALEGRIAVAAEGQIVTDSKAFDDGTRIEAPCLLAHAPVGAGARIGPLTTLAPRARVGRRAHVERSIVHEEASIGDDAVVVGSIVGRGAVVPDGVEIRDGIVV